MIDKIIAVLWSIVDFLEQYNGTVTAAATVFIGIFTLVLAQVTGRQARLTNATLDLARKEFLSTHRPKLILREAFSPMPKEDGPISVQFVISNIGSSRAWIVESSIHLEVCKTARLWLVPEPSKQMNLTIIDNPVFEAGDSKRFIHTSKLEWDSDSRRSYEDDDRGMYFVGSFIYLDKRNTRRQTAFRRRYNPGGERFFRVSTISEDYECADQSRHNILQIG